ncbi:hypothetical protein BKP44_14415 [Formosa algae]|nr:hypothetical protein BKP44_14415 [Formosa algae]
MRNKMKVILTILILLFFVEAFSQNKENDSIYFKYNENYILFYENFKNLNYKEFERRVLQNISKTKTEGYFILKKTDTLYNLNPKQIFDLKEYVENRAFYYSGTYNKTINKDLLKEKIFNKYKVFIVKNNTFITIRQHPFENFYNSYYPIKYEDKNKYPTQLKDTLYLKYNKKYLIEKIHPYENYTYYYFKNSGNNGSFFLKQKIFH